MGWISEDGLHEGYLVPQFGDGQRGLGVVGGGIPDDQIAVSHDREAEHGYGLRPAGEVTGWVVCCDCSTRDSFGPMSTWVGPVFTRVPSAALEDLSRRRLHAADADVADAAFRPEVEDAAREPWRLEHVFTTDALGEVAAATSEATAAQRRLEAAVRFARHSGGSWEAIGRAAGMSRQSAHERWRHVDAPVDERG